MKQYFLLFNQIDFSKFEFFGEMIVEKKIILLDATNEDEAEKEAKDRFEEAKKTARAKCDRLLEKKVKTLVPFHEWKPTNPSLVMKMSL